MNLAEMMGALNQYSGPTNIGSAPSAVQALFPGAYSGFFENRGNNVKVTAEGIQRMLAAQNPQAQQQAPQAAPQLAPGGNSLAAYMAGLRQMPAGGGLAALMAGR